MTWKVAASFERGVFVPDNRPMLAEHERVRLTVERMPNEITPEEPGATADQRADRDRAVALDFHPDGC